MDRGHIEWCTLVSILIVKCMVVLVWMIGFISRWVTHSHLITCTHRQYNAIAYLHIFQFTVAQALGFPVSTSHLLATDLNTELPQPHTPSITHKSSLHNWCRELTEKWLQSPTENYSRTSFSLSYKPLITHAGNAPLNGASIVASLLKCVTSPLTWSRDLSSLLCHPSVYSCCAVRLGMARQSSAWHRENTASSTVA
jgi:hypothetical protein